MRAEVLLGAFAEDVFTSSDGRELQVKGQAPDRAVIEGVLLGGWSRRLVAFRVGG
jgi:hypothetical protein